MTELLSLAIAGAAGTVSRYVVSGWAYRLLGERFAFGTLAVNVVGCFLLALVMQVALVSDAVPRSLRLALTVGFLGAFTTFSTFGYETLRYLEDGAWLLATANVAANLIVGLSACWAGLLAANALTGGV